MRVGERRLVDKLGADRVAESGRRGDLERGDRHGIVVAAGSDEKVALCEGTNRLSVRGQRARARASARKASLREEQSASALTPDWCGLNEKKGAGSATSRA